MLEHNDSAAQKFRRRIRFATLEYEAGAARERLSSGLRAAIASSKRKTQTGNTKGNGRFSSLEQLQPTPARLRRMKQAIRPYNAGKYGLRTLAAKIASILRMPKMGYETARRMIAEIKTKRL